MTTCSIDGCQRPAESRGWCGTHYMRWRRRGDPLAVKRRVGRTDEQRFWDYVDKSGPCWLWTGALSSGGYGNFYLGRPEGGYQQVAAHRWSYGKFVGPIPDGLVIDHLCRSRACVRPQHLQPVPQRVNVLRGDVARALRENACKRGHPFTLENTYFNRAGARVCRTCQRAAEAAYRQRLLDAGVSRKKRARESREARTAAC